MDNRRAFEPFASATSPTGPTSPAWPTRSATPFAPKSMSMARFATQDDGDIVITTALQKFQRNPLTFQSKDIIATRDYDVILTAHVKAIEVGSGKVLLDQEVLGRTSIRSTADLGSAERQAAPLLAENLARNIISRLSEGSW